MDAEKDPLVLIARLSVDTAAQFKGKYPEEILQAFVLTAKYMTIAGLDKNIRKRAATVATSSSCPLCSLYLHDNCKGCVLKQHDGIGCGHQYDGLQYAIVNGTFTDIAFNLSKIIRNCLSSYMDTM